MELLRGRMASEVRYAVRLLFGVRVTCHRFLSFLLFFQEGTGTERTRWNPLETDRTGVNDARFFGPVNFTKRPPGS